MECLDSTVFSTFLFYHIQKKGGRAIPPRLSLSLRSRGLLAKDDEKLLARFGTEIRVLHEASEEEIAETVGEKLAQLIVLARSGALYIEAGGGGRYGKVREA
ncbi:hypothetical protein [Geobacillus stearothermophilus]|uniref:hypothetical protein n=1 Tax=Geobacillus stearothermophilus TaxID=1422 RepID=UPI003D1B91EF